MIATLTASAPAPPQTPVSSIDHISWSGLKTYATCPRKYMYRYIECVPEEHIGASLAYGASFHRAVELIQQARLEGAKLPEIEALLSEYDKAWNEESTKAPEVQYPKTENAASLRQMAERMLTAFREHIIATADKSSGMQIIAIEHAHRVRILADLPPLEMRIDLLARDGENLIVEDLKTARSKWNDMKVQESLPQLILYANALMPILRELGLRRIVPRFLVVSKAKKPVVQVLEPQATQTDVQRLKRQIIETWDAIQKGVFHQTQSFWCAQCPYRRRCLG